MGDLRHDLTFKTFLLVALARLIKTLSASNFKARKLEKFLLIQTVLNEMFLDMISLFPM